MNANPEHAENTAPNLRTTSQRLRDAIHFESATIAPHTSEIIEAVREAAETLGVLGK